MTLANLVAAHGINGFRSSVAARQACCGVRKVAPLRRALAGAAAWITGLRAEQSRHRADVALAAFDETQGLIKFNPLADWTRGDVERFVADHRIPYNVAARPRLPLDRLRAVHARRPRRRA